MATELRESRFPPLEPAEGSGAAARIRDPRIRQLYLYWQSKRRGRRAPSRADIDPTELRAVLPYLYMFDVVEPGTQLRYRLMGTAVVDIAGELTGKFIDEVLPQAVYARLRPQYLDVVHNFVGRYDVTDMAWQGRPYIRYHRLLLPLSDDQVAANIVLGICCYDGTRRQQADSVMLSRLQPGEQLIDERIVPDPAP